jgi:hypothetical protein
MQLLRHSRERTRIFKFKIMIWIIIILSLLLVLFGILSKRAIIIKCQISQQAHSRSFDV